MKRQTKRRRNAFWAAALGTFAAFVFSTASASAQVDGFVWKVDETGATLVSANKNKKSARIPATFNGKSGVAVGFQAFRNPFPTRRFQSLSKRPRNIRFHAGVPPR